MSKHTLTIEIRHAAAERAAGDNTHSVATPPPAPENTKKPVAKPPMHGNPGANENKAAPEGPIPYAKENIGAADWAGAAAAAKKKMAAALKGK